MPVFTAPIPTIRHDASTPSPADSLVGRPVAGPSDVRRRVSLVLLLRTLLISVVLGLSVWVLMVNERPVRSAVWFQSGIIAVTYLSSIVFGVMLRLGVAPRTVVRPMHAADIVVTSLLVYVTGGAQSPYTFMYALSIVAAGAISYRRGAAVTTAASLAAIIIVALMAWARVLDLPFAPEAHPWEQSGAALARTLGIQLATLTGVGALAFVFGDQLQRGAETLATTRRAAADLFTLHQDIVRSLAAGLVTTSPDGIVLSANQAAREILGHGRALGTGGFVGQPIDLVMPGLTALSPTVLGELRRADLKLAGHGDRGPSVIGVTVSPLRDVNDQVIGRVINFQDLTELRRLEQDVRRAERLATVGQLAAGVAHEIRNPLAAISGSIELLKATPQNPDDATLMSIVQREVTRLNELIGDLLDYANPRPSQPVACDLAVLVKETVQVARADQTFADVELTADVMGALPYRGDPAKLRQVLWNLVRNAADAAAGGGKHVRVTARVAPGSVGLVAITVADDGPGIPDASRARIFDPFFTTKRKGTGLGLATCHAIVVEHGGGITVETSTTEPTGSRFTVTLPPHSALRVDAAEREPS